MNRFYIFLIVSAGVIFCGILTGLFLILTSEEFYFAVTHNLALLGVQGVVIGLGVLLLAITITGKLFKSDRYDFTTPATTLIIIGVVIFACSSMWQAVTAPSSGSTAPQPKKRYGQEVDLISNNKYNNPSGRQQLIVGRPYRFVGGKTVYVYDGWDLRPFANPEAFLRHYKCNTVAMEACKAIYDMPSHIKKGDSILKGKMIY